MKQLIVLVASIILGISIVNTLIIKDDSILDSMQNMWRSEIEIRDMRNSL